MLNHAVMKTLSRIFNGKSFDIQNANSKVVHQKAKFRFVRGLLEQVSQYK